MLKTRHWAAVSYHGAVHFVADQGTAEEPVPFDEQRLQVVRDKYFLAYLIATVQRLTFQRAVAEAAAAVRDPNTTDERLRTLRRELVEFSVAGHVTEISHRDAINRYYRLCQDGQGVDQAAERARRTIADAEASREAESRRTMAAGLAGNVEQVAQIQRKIEWLEVFFVSFYAAELAHILSHAFHFGAAYASWGALGWATAGGVIAFWMLRPDRHSEARAPCLSPRAIAVRAGLILLLVAGWFVVGFTTIHHETTAADLLPLERRLAAQLVDGRALPFAEHPAVRRPMDMARSRLRLAAGSKASGAFEATRRVYEEVLALVEEAAERSAEARHADDLREQAARRMAAGTGAAAAEAQALADQAASAFAAGEFGAAARLWKDALDASAAGVETQRLDP